MSEELKLEQPELTLKDRLPMTYLFASQITKIQKARLIEDLALRRISVTESIQGFVHLIPENWKDEKFGEQCDKAKTIVKKDVRPTFAGQRLSKKLCEARGIRVFKEVVTYDYNLMLQACMNLLDRKGMTSRREFVEEALGIPFDELGESLAEKPGE